MTFLSSDVHNKKRLVLLCELEVVCFKEVLCYRDLVPLSIIEEFSNRILVKNYILHNVGFLISPVSNNTLVPEFSEYLTFCISTSSLINLIDSLETRSGRHELVDVVNH